jgi:signal transduction histidine kinase
MGLVFRDITDERRLQEKVVQAEKSSGLSLLASGIGHELNNPLSGIMGLSEAIADETDLTVIRDHAKTVVTQAKRMAEVIQSLIGQGWESLDDSRVPLELNGLIQDVIGQLRSSGAAEGLEIRTRYDPLRPIRARPHEIRQMLGNVVTNAIQAMNGNGILDVTTAPGDGQITVRIRDTGCGIPSGYLSKVFDPFFTTRRQGEGRGLGLTTARRIVESLGGEITVESEEGRGTTVLITFPVLDPSEARRKP